MISNEEELNHEEPEIIYIPDDDGNEEEFEVIAKFEVDDSGKKYMVVMPVEEQEGDQEEVYAFRYEEDGDDLTLFIIEDEEEWDIVEEAFHTILSEMEMGQENES